MPQQRSADKLQGKGQDVEVDGSINIPADADSRVIAQDDGLVSKGQIYNELSEHEYLSHEGFKARQGLSDQTQVKCHSGGFCMSTVRMDL